MIIWRRFLALAALAFWQGGFAFYAAVVVPMGEQVLSSPIEQGFVTRRVTNYLNLAGAVALPLLLWEIAAAKPRRRARAASWIVLAGMLGAEIGLHPALDRHLDADAMVVLDEDRFETVHQLYLIASTLQWFASVAFLVSTLQVWRENDAAHGPCKSVAEFPE